MFRLAGLVLSFSTLCAAKVNLAELEEISDELPERDCFRLLSALNDSEWQINRTHFEQFQKDQPNDWPCIKRLQKWYRNQGHRESGELLALRLSQLGYPELSAWLSKRISQEEVDVVGNEFFHFRRFARRKGENIKNRSHSRAKLHGNKLQRGSQTAKEVEQTLSSDPWSKWRWLAVVATLLLLIQVFCCCFLSIVPKDQMQRFRQNFYVHLCGWKRDPPPGEFHYLCI